MGATAVGWFFIVVGAIGLAGAGFGAYQGEVPITARVTSSMQSPDSVVVVTRISLPGGGSGVIESRDSYAVASTLEVEPTGDSDDYAAYSATAPWLGSGLALVAGAMLVGVSRATRRPFSPPVQTGTLGPF